jgi:putative DNA methylase
VKHAGVVFAAGGIVRLLKWSDYPADWNPATDTRLPVWEALHQLIRDLKTDGETGAGKVFAAIQDKAEATRQLAYRLHTLCERAGWAEDARAYNEIVTSWSAIESAASAAPVEKQASLFG